MSNDLVSTKSSELHKFCKALEKADISFEKWEKHPDLLQQNLEISGPEITCKDYFMPCKQKSKAQQSNNVIIYINYNYQATLIITSVSSI